MIRFDTVQFRIDHIQRIRSTPNDNFGNIYLEETGITETHDALVRIICSQATTDAFADTTNGTIGYFKHITTVLEPIPIYGDYFNLRSDPMNSKVEAFKTYSTFISPRFYLYSNPLTC